MTSDQGLHCLLTECSMKNRIKMKNNSEEPLKREWTGPIDNGEKFHSALMGWVHTRDYVGGAIRRVNAYVVPT